MLIYIFYFVGERGHGLRTAVCKMASPIIKTLHYALRYRLQYALHYTFHYALDYTLHYECQPLMTIISSITHYATLRHLVNIKH